jgi:hypothetical protein
MVQNEWVKECTFLKTTRHKRGGALVNCTNTSDETSPGMLQARGNH